jgi:hypothetical protein
VFSFYLSFLFRVVRPDINLVATLPKIIMYQLLVPENIRNNNTRYQIEVPNDITYDTLLITVSYPVTVKFGHRYYTNFALFIFLLMRYYGFCIFQELSSLEICSG